MELALLFGTFNLRIAHHVNVVCDSNAARKAASKVEPRPLSIPSVRTMIA